MRRMLTFILILIFAGYNPAEGQETGKQLDLAPGLDRWTEWGKFKSANGPEWHIKWNKQTGVPDMIYMGITDKAYNGSPEQSARAFLADYRALFRMKEGLSGLLLQKVVLLNGTSHVRFQQIWKGLPVKDAVYLVHVRKNGKIDMANGTYYPQIQAPAVPLLSETIALQTAEQNLGRSMIEPRERSAELVVYPSGEEFLLAWKVELQFQKPLGDWQYYIDAESGTILEKQNRMIGFAAGSDNSDNLTRLAEKDGINLSSDKSLPDAHPVVFTTGYGNIYPTYPGGPGSSIPVLRTLYRLDGTGYLEGQYVTVENGAGSNAYEPSHDFTYQSSDPHFDEVNAYYHVDKYRNDYINGLGFNGFTEVDAVINPGQCNPYYNSGSHSIQLVDGSNCTEVNNTALEDKVIYHEYTHGVMYSVGNALWSSSDEKGAISEGTPDYFASSYADYRTTILDWSWPEEIRDVANPFYSHYNQLPTDGNGNVDAEPHRGGEFFSAILWDIRNRSPITVHEADIVVLGAVARLDADPTFTEFRDAMKAEDSALYYGVHNDLIHNIFAEWGIGNPVYYAYIEGPSQIQPDDPATWEAVVYGGTPPYSYQWYKDYTLDGTGQFYTTSDDDDFNLFLQVNDEGGSGDQYVDSRYIYVSSGFAAKSAESEKYVFDDNPTGTEQKKIYNEFSVSVFPNPFNPAATVSYTLPEQAEVSIQVYDVMGRKVAELVEAYQTSGTYTSRFGASGLSSGIYLSG